MARGKLITHEIMQQRVEMFRDLLQQGGGITSSARRSGVYYAALVSYPDLWDEVQRLKHDCKSVAIAQQRKAAMARVAAQGRLTKELREQFEDHQVMRTAAMALLRAMGWSLRKIGAAFGITGEAVRLNLVNMMVEGEEGEEQ